MLTRRKLIAAGGLALAGCNGASLSASAKPNWNWKLLVPHSKTQTNIPVPRDSWNGMLAHNHSLYLFGGVYPRYGPPRGPADLKTMGSLNDLWRYDITEKSWQRLQADNGLADFQNGSTRPCGRVLPCWVEVGGKFYLFGGLTSVAKGWKMKLLNDLWQFNPSSKRWTLLEGDDQRHMKNSTKVGTRPETIAAMGAAAIGRRIYLYSGWGGTRSRVVLSSQLWSFDVVTRKWRFHGDERRSNWPAKRYCPAFTAYKGKLYLCGGRDSESPRPQFYNDLWTFNPQTNRWRQLLKSDRSDTKRPSPRYAMGHARIGNQWIQFAGFGNNRGNSPQLNDLWQLDLDSGLWRKLQEHNGYKVTGPQAQRPCVRRVPAMTAIGKHAYLFGGLDLTSGPQEDGPLIAFNDLWQGELKSS